MLLLGSKKYPEETTYHMYLNNHGGKRTNSTSTHNTCYAVELPGEHLEGALEIVSQFLIAPLFNKSAVEREINAVNNENIKNLQNDYRRTFQLDKYLANHDHPFSKFGTGNKQTLTLKNGNVRDELIKFYNKYYSVNITKLCVIGTQSLSELNDMVTKMFAKIANKNVKRPVYNSNVFDKNKFPKLYKILPVKNMRELRICWFMESKRNYVLERPLDMILHCLNDKGNGSILSELKQKHWLTNASAGIRYDKREFCLMQMNFSLTDKGLKHWENIVDIVYGYVYLMNKISDTEWKKYYNEIVNVKTLNFKFKGKETPLKYCKTLSYSMFYDVDRKYILNIRIPKKFDYKLIKKYMGFITPKNGYYSLICKDIEDEVNLKEKWYGTEYSQEKVDDQLILKWENSLKKGNNEYELKLPELNEYIATDFGLCCDEIKRDNEAKQDNIETENDDVFVEPKIVMDTNAMRIYYKMDTEFKQPKVCFSFRMTYNIMDNSVLNQLLIGLFIRIIDKELLVEYSVFKKAYLKYNISRINHSAIQFEFWGYNHYLR